MKIRLWRYILMIAMVVCAIVESSGQYNKDYFFWVSRNCIINNDFRGAITTLNTLLNADSDIDEAYFLRGVAKYNMNDILGAESDFTLAIAKNPVYTTAYTYRAIVRSQLGDYDDALHDFQRAIDLRPDLPDPYYSRGVTRLMSQQFENAIEDFDLFITHNKRVADAYINRGVSYLYLKDTVKAYDNFNTAIRTNRENPDGYNRRGSLYMQQRIFDKAEEDFNMAINCDSTYLLAFFNRAMVYSETKRPAQSLADFDTAIKLDSTNSLTYFNRAIVRGQVGEYNLAMDDYNKVVEYSPNNVLAYFCRAQLKGQLGDLEGAIDDYTRSIELYPEFANAYINRAYLKQALRDPQGAKRDRAIAQQKINSYKARVSDTTYSIYSDTTQRLDKLLSFDSRFTGSVFERVAAKSSTKEDMELLPLFKFTLNSSSDSDSAPIATRHYAPQRLADFQKVIGNDMLSISNSKSNITADSLSKIDEHYKKSCEQNPDDWKEMFMRSVSQTLISQYTSAINTISEAIKLNPANPFLYLNRSTTRAEMIDFISSIDNSYQRISIDSDPANRLLNRHTRVYNYDEAMDDLNIVVSLYPDFAYGYYNRGNLLALSGELPKAYDEFTKAIELDPNFAEAYYNRGVVQIFMKDTRKGALDLSKAGELGLEKSYEVLKTYNYR